MNFKAYVAVAAVALAPLTASAATVAPTVEINFQYFGATKETDIVGAIAARDKFIGSMPIVAHETFDGFSACTSKTDSAGCSFSPLETSVGKFTGITPFITSGGSQVAPNDKIVVRSDSPDKYGRFDVEGTDTVGKWLDSNDMQGINWDIPGNSGLSNITKLAFFLTDVDDVGNVSFKLSATNQFNLDKTFQRPSNSKLEDGNLILVTMLFGEAVDNLNIQMISGTNDGFGVDGIKVGANAPVAPVPLPAAGFLLFGALGGLAALRRRKKATAA